MSTELDEKLARFEQRQLDRKPANDEAEAQRQEEMRQAYLKRTGRTSLVAEIPAGIQWRPVSVTDK